MNKKDGITLWREEGDLDRMNLFFQKNNPSPEQKERIKELTLTRIQEEEAKLPREGFDSSELQDFEEYKNPFLQRLSHLFKSLRWNKTFKVVLPLVILFVLVWAGKGFPPTFGSLDQQKSAAPETMNQAASAPKQSADMAYSTASESLASGAGQPSVARDSGVTNPKAPEVVPPPIDANIERKITYNIYLSLQVEDLNQEIERLTQDVKNMGGYVAESYHDNSTGNDNARVTLKIPTNQLDQFQASLSERGKILNQQSTANDITAQYYDAETRLHNWEAQEQRYLELFKEAKNLDEILKVEDALNNIRLQIEQLKGQLKLWDHEVAYSTVQLNLQTNTRPVKIEDPWEPITFAKTWIAAKAAVLKTISFIWNALNYLIVGIAYALPFLGLGILVYGVYYFLRKKHHK